MQLRHFGKYIQRQVTMKWLHGIGAGLYRPLRLELQSSFMMPAVLSKQYSCYLGKWELPQGYETAINLYNTAASKKVPLILRNNGIATWYICGPTVYDESHIGHASCYVKFDVIRRILESIFGINVLLLMGITDIDDKIIKKASEMGLSASEVSKKYELDFFKDMDTMRMKPPSFVSRVTENIQHIICFIEKLIEKNYAYVTDEGNVYFMVAKSISSDITSEMVENLQSAIDPAKLDKRDFALWKAAKKDEPFWLSPWGNGRPGWHIECSVMASNIFGSHLDLHSGGSDLLFPHHSNEKSQSEAYHGCSQWGNYWLHSGLLQVGDEIKMSKSIKNTISIKEFLKDNSVNDFRFFCLQSLYRKNVYFSSETLTGAKGLHKKFHNFINDSELCSFEDVKLSSVDEDQLLSKLKSTKEEVISLLADDFNTGQALLCLTNLIDGMNECLESSPHSSLTSFSGVTVIAAYSSYIDNILNTLGVKIICKKKLGKDLVCFMDAITEFRKQIRSCALGLTQIEENQTVSSFIDQAYKSFSQKIGQIDNIEELLPNATHIKSAVDLLYKQTSEFALTIQEIKDIQLDKMNKKKLLGLLVYCDDLRSSLEKYGIAIKDRKGMSNWLPLTTLQL